MNLISVIYAQCSVTFDCLNNLSSVFTIEVSSGMRVYAFIYVDCVAFVVQCSCRMSCDVRVQFVCRTLIDRRQCLPHKMDIYHLQSVSMNNLTPSKQLACIALYFGQCSAIICSLFSLLRDFARDLCPFFSMSVP